MDNLAIDQNERNTGGGVIQGTSQTLPTFINPLTGELLVEIIPTSTDGTIISQRNLPIDENERNCAGAVTDDSDETLIPLTVVMRKDLPCLRIDANLV